MPDSEYMPPGFYTEEHYYSGYTEWVEMKKEEAYQRNVAELVRHFYLLVVQQQQCAFTDLPDDVVVRILSHSDAAQLKVASTLNRHMRRLASEQQESAEQTSYQDEYGEWELLYPQDKDTWIRAWSTDGSRKSYFNRLKVKEDNAVGYIEHVQAHYQVFMNSYDMKRMVANANEIVFRSEVETMRLPADWDTRRKLEKETYRLPYQVFVSCSAWRK